MTQGGGFTSGEDFVAARVSIDVPTEGIQSLREMSQAVDRFRTSVETAGRSSASFVSYIQQMIQAGTQATQVHQNLAAQLERTSDIQSRSQTGMPGMSGAQALTTSRSAPGAYVDNFAGMGVGMGGVRSPSPGDVSQQLQSQAIDPTRQLDPRKYLNAQAGRYRIQPGELSSPTGAPDWQAHADRVEQRDKQQRDQEVKTPGGALGDSGGGGSFSSQVGRAGGLANNIMREMGPGGSSMSTLGMMSQGLRAAGKHISAAAGSGDEDGGDATETQAKSRGLDGILGGMGGLAKGLGGAGLGLGAGLAAVGAVEKGGAMYQGYKNMGLIRGGGAGQGMQDEMSMRSLALNPFISNEQSRQIIMAGLTEGYSGKQFDTVTQFMASNLKDMNISVSDSVGMLRKNVVEGGQSIQGLGASLAVLKGLSQNGVQSLPDLTQNFAATSGALIDSGVSGGAAGQMALKAGAMFGNDRLLAGVGGPMATGMSPAGLGMLKSVGGANIPAGLMPDEVLPYMGAHGQDPQDAIMKVVKSMASSMLKGPAAQKGSVAYLNALGQMTRILGIYFPGAHLNQPMVEDMVNTVLSGDPSADAQKSLNAQTQAVKGPEGFIAGMGEQLGAAGTTVRDIGKRMLATVTGNQTANDNAAADVDKTWSNVGYHEFASASNPILDNIVNQYGAGNVVVVDKNGNSKPLTGSKDQVQALAKGDLTWKRKGEQGNGQTLAMGPADMDPNFRNGGNTNVSFSPATVNVNVNTSTGQATASPNVLQLTPNQQQVNAGMGSNTANNPPPGDGFGYRYTGTGTR